MQNVVEYFNKRGSTVYLATLDASKAFDRLTHVALFKKLLKRSVPMCCIKCLLSWYNKLYSCVRWSGCFSSPFNVCAGVRQGGVLSPVLFNLYVDELVDTLESCGLGCHVVNKSFACIFDADDILIISPTVAGLQTMLNLCFAFATENGMTFNNDKSFCMQVGRPINVLIQEMLLGNDLIHWVDNFKYLGIQFNCGATLHVDCVPVKKKFYAAFNSILCGCKAAPENVKVFLISAYCLPLLTYCLGALKLNAAAIDSLAVCWNDAFRKIFGLNRWESVRTILLCCDVLPVKYLYDLHRWNFLMSSGRLCAPVSHLVSVLVHESNVIQKFTTFYACGGGSVNARRKAVIQHFKNSLTV